jgi:hypothetical protein
MLHPNPSMEVNMPSGQNTHKASVPTWFWIAGVLGLAWNAFGVVQFIGSLSATTESLMAAGLDAEQAAVMLGYPLWMTIAFAIGVFGGLVGSLLLLVRKRVALPVFAVSLIGYLVLYVGDVTEGVFAAIGTSQVVILSLVVAIAVALLWMTHYFNRNGALS